MQWIQRFWLRLQTLFRRNRSTQRLNDEIQFHLDQQIAENLADGMSPQEARHATMRTFGNSTILKEETRDTWGWIWVEQIGRDLRHAMRTLSRTPTFTAMAVLVMALGVGANTTLFSVVRSVLLKPLPFKDPEQLVMLYEQSADGKYPYNVVAGGIFQEWQKQSRSFEQMALLGGTGYNLSGANGVLPEKLEGGKCSWNLFSTLGVRPVYGRLFTADDDSPNANATALLTWSLWKRRFSGDPALVGKDILLDGENYAVIGILPAWFSYPDPETQLWTPIRHETRPAVMDSLNNHQFAVIARLRAGSTPTQALTDLDTIEKQIRSGHPGLIATIGIGANLRKLLDEVVGDYKTPLYVLLAATGCFLLIACLNVANLLVARSAARRREFAIRAALGGSRGRILLEQVVESVVISVSGGAVGIALAWFSLQWLAVVRHDIPRVETIHIDLPVLLFAAVIALLSGVAAGLLPALSASGTRILQTLQESSRSYSGGPTRAKLRRFLLALEVGFTVVLLIAAGLLLKSYERLRSSELGCGTENTLTMRVDLPKPKYLEQQRTAFFERLIDRVRSMPGVRKAGMVSVLPGHGYGGDDPFTIFEHPPLPPGQVLFAIKRFADPGYFAAMEIPLLRGRPFNDRDRLGQATSVIISDRFAGRFLPNEDPIGKHLQVNLTDHQVTYEIVGVVGDTRFQIAQPAEPTMYFPLYSGIFGRATIVLQSPRDPSGLALPVQKLVAELDPDLPVSDVLTMEQLIAGSTINASFTASLVLAFAVLSLLLAAVGLYGVLSCLATQRKNEIGVRVALGAQRGDIMRLMLIDGLRPAAVGLITGLVVGALAAGYIRSMLYGVEPLDGGVFVAVTLLLSLIAGAACIFPAWHASHRDPVEALRAD